MKLHQVVLIHCSTMNQEVNQQTTRNESTISISNQSPRNHQKESTMVDDDPVGKLQEYCTRARLPSPKYIEEEFPGPTGLQLVVVSVNVDSETVKAKATAKHLAKAAAAQLMIERMRKRFGERNDFQQWFMPRTPAPSPNNENEGRTNEQKPSCTYGISNETHAILLHNQLLEKRVQTNQQRITPQNMPAYVETARLAPNQVAPMRMPQPQAGTSQVAPLQYPQRPIAPRQIVPRPAPIPMVHIPIVAMPVASTQAPNQTFQTQGYAQRVANYLDTENPDPQGRAQRDLDPIWEIEKIATRIRIEQPVFWDQKKVKYENGEKWTTKLFFLRRWFITTANSLYEARKNAAEEALKVLTTMTIAETMALFPI